MDEVVYSARDVSRQGWSAKHLSYGDLSSVAGPTLKPARGGSRPAEYSFNEAVQSCEGSW